MLNMLCPHLTQAYLNAKALDQSRRDVRILGSSRRTVDKHCEHIFRKLGVESRTAAARVALSSAPGEARS